MGQSNLLASCSFSNSPSLSTLPARSVLHETKAIFGTTEGTPFIFPGTGTGGWESALTNTLSPGDKVVTFRCVGQGKGAISGSISCRQELAQGRVAVGRLFL